MTAQELIQSASELQLPTVASAKEYDEKQDLMVAELNSILKAREDLETLIGPNNTDMMMDNHQNHARYLTSVFYGFQPTNFVETILWVFRAYRSHGFNLTYWPAQLNNWVVVIKKHLSPEAYNEIYPFYQWMLRHQPSFVAESDRVIIGSQTPSHGNERYN